MADWSREDTYREMAYLMAHGADWSQTQYIQGHPKYRELNPILGAHPSRGRVNNYFLAAGLLHPLISYSIPSIVEYFGGSPETAQDVRKWWQLGSAAFEAGVVGRNAHMGIGFSW